MTPRSTSNERMLNITVRDPISGCFLSERAFLHGIVASLLLAHNSLLWYSPNGKPALPFFGAGPV